MLDLVLVLGIPLLGGLTLTILQAIASQKRLSTETSQDVALDMTFLALGAAGSAFHSPHLQQRYPNSVAGLSALFVGTFLIAAVLLYLRRFSSAVSNGLALANLLLGSFAIGLVAGVIYLGR